MKFSLCVVTTSEVIFEHVGKLQDIMYGAPGTNRDFYAISKLEGAIKSHNDNL